jgi:hypothetical protein
VPLQVTSAVIYSVVLASSSPAGMRTTTSTGPGMGPTIILTSTPFTTPSHITSIKLMVTIPPIHMHVTFLICLSVALT